MILHATHTHLYPGHRGTVTGFDKTTGSKTEQECLLVFDDGTATSARLSVGDDDWLLETSAYRTAAGTSIGDKCWRLKIEQDGDQTRFRVVAKGLSAVSPQP